MAVSISLNIIDDMTLNLFTEDSSLSIVSESELYNFSHGKLAETLDEVLDEISVDGDVELNSLTLDFEVDHEGDVFGQITESLRSLLKSKLQASIFKAQSTPVTNMLADVYRQHLPMDKTSNLERQFNVLADAWRMEHDKASFDSLDFSASIVKKMQAEFPHLDLQQIAYVVYHKILQMKGAKKVQDGSAISDGTMSATSQKNHEVADSGIVLLSPYLQVLFERLGCIESGKWKTENAQLKALSILKYATFGAYKEPPKNAAVMNLLCGLPMSPVFLSDELPKISESEKELIDGLLKAVITNWGAVGHMSPDGLRSTYFVRLGKIDVAEKEDLLTVENNTFDFLLDKLTWGYSKIKYSWMPKLLNVKWR